MPGHVVRIIDPFTTPPKPKRIICVCPHGRRFLRINSQPLWLPHHRLSLAKNHTFLDHDSYVELRQLLRFGPADLERALSRASNLLGRMTPSEAMTLAWAAKRAETLSQELQNLIWERLVDER